jgi:Tfp pilus assembly protein PilN
VLIICIYVAAVLLSGGSTMAAEAPSAQIEYQQSLQQQRQQEIQPFDAAASVNTLAESISKNGEGTVILAVEVVIFVLFAVFFVSSQKAHQREQSALIRSMQETMQDNIKAFRAEIAEERRVYRDSMQALVGSINELQIEMAKLSSRIEK